MEKLEFEPIIEAVVSSLPGRPSLFFHPAVRVVFIRDMIRERFGLTEAGGPHTICLEFIESKLQAGTPDGDKS